jgi:pimeloyl-ACP methyl ester carboxylesterase
VHAHAPWGWALPGTLLDERSLAPALDGLDLRCVGLGEAPTLEAELDRLAALSTGPAWWLGHSLGAIVALHLAWRHPQVVAGLVLLAGNARAGRETSGRRRAAQWALAKREGLAALAMSKLAPAYGWAESAAGRGESAAAADGTQQEGEGAPPEPDRIAQLAAQAQAVGLRRFRHQLRYAATRPGADTGRPRLRVPLLAVSGEHDLLCPPADSAALLALVAPDVSTRHHCLSGAGHLFMTEQPAALRAAIDHFRAVVQAATPDLPALPVRPR